MKSTPKIIVLKMREIIYTLLLLFLVILLILCLILMFSKKTVPADDTGQNALESTQATEQLPESAASASPYHAGVYTSALTLGDTSVDVEVTVDSDHINGIRLVNLSEATAAAYPLVSTSLSQITAQILETQKLEGITVPTENRYTSQLLLSAISDALTRARTQE
jgi:uncharacterized protein with FMN-binding domain